MEKTAKSLYVIELVEKMEKTSSSDWTEQDVDEACFLAGMWVRLECAKTGQDVVKITTRALKKLRTEHQKLGG